MAKHDYKIAFAIGAASSLIWFFTLRNLSLLSENELIAAMLSLPVLCTLAVALLPYLLSDKGEGPYDVVIGSRAVKGCKLNPPQPFYRQLFGKAGNLVIQLTNVPGIWDTQCGFKAFTEEAAEKIFSISRINSWGFDIEALALARAMGYKIKEVPVYWVHHPKSYVRLSDYLKTFVENFKVRWWIATDRYQLKTIPKNLG